MIKLLSLLFTLLFTTTVNSSTLLILGDSLSAGYKIPIAQNWTSLLPAQLDQQGKPLDVINASISGDTTGNGLARLPTLLTQHQPDYVLIELGANDGLRGFNTHIVTDNLTAIISAIKAAKATPLLMQIQIPPNYGKRYSQAFSSLYGKLSVSEEIPLLPFYLQQVILNEEWMQADGLHPNVLAQPWIADYMAKELIKVLD